MDGLLSFLLFAGLFFLMMRYGCGARMVHGGHDGHGSHGNPGARHEVRHSDPVCGMEVAADQGYGKMREGKLYQFCSRNCLDKFEAEPERYLNPPAEGEGGAQ